MWTVFAIVLTYIVDYVDCVACRQSDLPTVVSLPPDDTGLPTGKTYRSEFSTQWGRGQPRNVCFVQMLLVTLYLFHTRIG